MFHNGGCALLPETEVQSVPLSSHLCGSFPAFLRFLTGMVTKISLLVEGPGVVEEIILLKLHVLMRFIPI